MTITEAQTRVAELARIAEQMPPPNKERNGLDPEAAAVVNQVLMSTDWLVEQLDMGATRAPEIDGLLTLLRQIQQMYRALWLGAGYHLQESTARPIMPQGSDQSQAWFWTPHWQTREREADAAIQNGDVIRYESEEAFEAARAALDRQLDARADV